MIVKLLYRSGRRNLTILYYHITSIISTNATKFNLIDAILIIMDRIVLYNIRGRNVF